MRSSDIYLLQLHIKKCKININESGSVGLLLRAGKNQSHVTELKPIIKGVINFNTTIKLNIDSSALDTQRCSLTLNFISAENIRRIIGIVVINLPEIGEEIQKTFKVTSTPDKDAQIELSISVSQLASTTKVKSKLQQKSSLNISEKGKIFQIQHEKKPEKSQKQKSIGQSLLLMTNKSQQNPTSPPSESTQKLNLKSKRSELQSFVQNEDVIGMIQKLKRQKQMLKQLLKLQMQKSAKATTHLKNIIDVLHVAIGVNFTPSLPQHSLRNSLPGDSSISKKDENFGFSKSNLHQTSPGMRSSNFLDVIKENRNLEMISNAGDSANRSYLSAGHEKSIDFAGILTQLKKKMQENGESKSEIKKLFDKIKSQPLFVHDPQKMRVLKTKIDKSYLSIIGKNTVTKEQILKHKIQINKFLDEFIAATNSK